MRYGYKHLVYGHKLRVTRRHQTFQGFDFDWSLGIDKRAWFWIIVISLVAGFIKTLQA